MFTLLNMAELRPVLERETAPFALSLLIAQVFFKWGSFALELLGFLFLWFVLGMVADRVLRKLGR